MTRKLTLTNKEKTFFQVRLTRIWRIVDLTQRSKGNPLQHPKDNARAMIKELMEKVK